MHPHSSRRQFLTRSLALSAGVVSGALGNMSSRMGAAIEPLTRRTSKFKFSLAAYSYRDLLTGDPPQLTLDDFIADCATMGLDGTELTSYYFPKDVSSDFLRGLKQSCFRLGLDVSGTAVGNDFCHPPGSERDQQIADVKRWVDNAEVLGAPVIRIFSGNVKEGQSEPEAHRLAVEAIEECCDYSGRHGVYLALENHGGLTTTVDGMLALVTDVRSAWFGVNLDTGNFHSADPYSDLEKLAPYALNVQVKVVMRPAGADQQAADFSRLARFLDDAAYRGYIVLEYEESEDPRQACPRHLDEMRHAFQHS